MCVCGTLLVCGWYLVCVCVWYLVGLWVVPGLCVWYYLVGGLCNRLPLSQQHDESSMTLLYQLWKHVRHLAMNELHKPCTPPRDKVSSGNNGVT